MGERLEVRARTGGEGRRVRVEGEQGGRNGDGQGGK